MVVDREPGGRHLGLAGDRRAVRGGHEAGPNVRAREHELLRHAVVADLDLEAPLHRAPRGDRQLLAVAAERRAPAVDLHAAHVQPDQVEVEAAQALDGRGPDRRLPLEAVARRVVRDVQVVVADVIAAVAVTGVVRVADAGRPRGTAAAFLLRLRHAGSAEQERRAGGYCHEPSLAASKPSHMDPSVVGNRAIYPRGRGAQTSSGSRAPRSSSLIFRVTAATGAARAAPRR